MPPERVANQFRPPAARSTGGSFPVGSTSAARRRARSATSQTADEQLLLQANPSKRRKLLVCDNQKPVDALAQQPSWESDERTASLNNASPAPFWHQAALVAKPAGHVDTMTAYPLCYQAHRTKSNAISTAMLAQPEYHLFGARFALIMESLRTMNAAAAVGLKPDRDYHQSGVPGATASPLLFTTNHCTSPDSMLANAPHMAPPDSRSPTSCHRGPMLTGHLSISADRPAQTSPNRFYLDAQQRAASTGSLYPAKTSSAQAAPFDLGTHPPYDGSCLIANCSTVKHTSPCAPSSTSLSSSSASSAGLSALGHDRLS